MAHTAFQWHDPLLLDQQLTDDERAVRDAARAYCQEQLAPRVIEAFRHEKTDPAIFRAASRALGLDPARCVYVGDHPEQDVAAARAVGMLAIDVTELATLADHPARLAVYAEPPRTPAESDA